MFLKNVTACIWKISDIPNNQPLYLEENPLTYKLTKFLKPYLPDKITISHGKRIKFACPAGNPNKRGNSNIYFLYSLYKIFSRLLFVFLIQYVLKIFSFLVLYEMYCLYKFTKRLYNCINII
jgi:hypothetical protein